MLYELIEKRELEESYLKDLFIKTNNDLILSILWGNDAKEEHIQTVQNKVIYWMPVIKNEFCDRKQLLERIYSETIRKESDRGNETIKVALVGQEGYGKDSLAIKFISEKSTNFKYIFWVKSQSEDCLKKDFEKISKILNVKNNHQCILDSLENEEEEWLIVYSKASIITLGNYIPKKGGSILVTSTEGNWSGLGFNKIEVDSFEGAITPENAKLVFPQIAKNLSIEGDFENAFKYFEKTKVLLERENPRNAEKYEKVIRDVAHCALKNGKPAKAVENYQKALNLRNESNKDIQESSDIIEGEKSALKNGKPAKVVENYQKDFINESKKDNQESSDSIEDKKSSAYYEYKIGECQRVNEDVLEAKIYYKKALESNLVEVDPLLNSKIYRGIGSCFEYQGKFEFALIYFNKSIEIIRQDLFVDTKYEFKCAKLKLNIASCLFKQRMIPKALKLYKEACHIFEHSEGKVRNKIRLAEALTGIANCYNYKGEGNESLILYQEALSIIETLCGKNHIKTVNIHNGIGLSYFYKRNIFASMSAYEKAHEVLEGITNSRCQHELNSNIFHGLGLCNLKLGDYHQGILNFEKALNYKKIRYGEKNLEFTVTLNGLGWISYEKRDILQARVFFLKAEKICLVLGEVESVEYSDTLHGLGSCLNYEGKIEESKDYFDKSLKIKEKHFGANHGEVAYLLYNIGRYYYGKESKGKKGSYLLEGENYCTQALRIMSCKFDKIEGNSNFECASVIDGLATFLRMNGKYEDAHARFEEARKIKESHYGRNHIKVGHSWKSLAYCKRTNSLLEFGNAEKCYNEALRIYKLHLPENHEIITKVNDDLNECINMVDVRKTKRSTSLSSVGSSGSGTLNRKKDSKNHFNPNFNAP